MLDLPLARRGSRLGLSGVVVLLATVSQVRVARADMTSWFAVYGGATSLGEQGAARATAPLLQLETGAGTSPAGALVVGGLLKSLTAFGRGTDVALTARFATGGFVRGGWGAAIDVGPYRRWWGVRSTGVIGQLVVGAPFGLQVTAFTEQGTNEAQSYGAALGIDLLRLTVYRATAQSSWYNPILPAGVER